MRSPVGSAGYGDNFSFDAVVPFTAPGTFQVGAYAINTGPGANALIGCRSIT